MMHFTPFSIQSMSRPAAISAAGKNKNKNRNKKRRKARKKARGKARQRCAGQIAQCEAAVAAECGDGEECLELLLPCCQSLAACDAATTLTCLFFTQPT